MSFVKSAISLLIVLMLACQPGAPGENKVELQAIGISGNQRFFQHQNGEPFFWLGNTGWLFSIEVIVIFCFL